MTCGPSAAEERDRGDAGRDAALDRERLPGRVLFVLGEAEGVLAGLAERGAIDAAGPAAADVAHHELERATDRRVGAVALPHRVDAGVHADAPADRTVDHDHRAHRHRGREQAVHVEGVGARRLRPRRERPAGTRAGSPPSPR